MLKGCRARVSDARVIDPTGNRGRAGGRSRVCVLVGRKTLSRRGRQGINTPDFVGDNVVNYCAPPLSSHFKANTAAFCSKFCRIRAGVSGKRSTHRLCPPDTTHTMALLPAKRRHSSGASLADLAAYRCCDRASLSNQPTPTRREWQTSVQLCAATARPAPEHS